MQGRSSLFHPRSHQSKFSVTGLLPFIILLVWFQDTSEFAALINISGTVFYDLCNCCWIWFWGLRFHLLQEDWDTDSCREQLSLSSPTQGHTSVLNLRVWIPAFLSFTFLGSSLFCLIPKCMACLVLELTFVSACHVSGHAKAHNVWPRAQSLPLTSALS